MNLTSRNPPKPPPPSRRRPTTLAMPLPPPLHRLLAFSGRIRRMLCTAATSRPDWSRRPEWQLAVAAASNPYLPPTNSSVAVPDHLARTSDHPINNCDGDFVRISGGQFRSVSQDGLCLLTRCNFPGMATLLGKQGRNQVQLTGLSDTFRTPHILPNPRVVSDLSAPHILRSPRLVSEMAACTVLNHLGGLAAPLPTLYTAPVLSNTHLVPDKYGVHDTAPVRANTHLIPDKYDDPDMDWLPYVERVKISGGWLPYVERFVLRSFTLTADGSGWTLKQKMGLSPLWADDGDPWLPLKKEKAPQTGILKLDKANVVHIIAGEHRFIMDMHKLQMVLCFPREGHISILPLLASSADCIYLKDWNSLYSKDGRSLIETAAKCEKRKPPDMSHWSGDSIMARKKKNTQTVREKSKGIGLQGSTVHNASSSSQRSSSGNSATVCLDDDGEESLKSYLEGIRRLRAWCRENGNYKDLSGLYGEGSEMFTTPGNGTFYMTIKYRERTITLNIYGKDLYFVGWTGGMYGGFEMKRDHKDPHMAKQGQATLPFGTNYSRLHVAGYGGVELGLQTLRQSFEALYCCDGKGSGYVRKAVTSMCVHFPECARLQCVLDAIRRAFLIEKSVKVESCKELCFWIKYYGHYCKQCMATINRLILGLTPEPIENRGDGKIRSADEILKIIRVYNRHAMKVGVFSPQAPDTDPSSATRGRDGGSPPVVADLLDDWIFEKSKKED